MMTTMTIALVHDKHIYNRWTDDERFKDFESIDARAFEHTPSERGEAEQPLATSIFKYKSVNETEHQIDQYPQNIDMHRFEYSMKNWLLRILVKYRYCTRSRSCLFHLDYWNSHMYYSEHLITIHIKLNLDPWLKLLYQTTRFKTNFFENRFSRLFIRWIEFQLIWKQWEMRK